MAVRIPKDLAKALEGKKIEILREGKDLILREVPEDLSQAFDILTSFPDDFFSQARVDLPPQNRKF